MPPATAATLLALLLAAAAAAAQDAPGPAPDLAPVELDPPAPPLPPLPPNPPPSPPDPPAPPYLYYDPPAVPEPPSPPDPPPESSPPDLPMDASPPDLPFAPPPPPAQPAAFPVYVRESFSTSTDLTSSVGPFGVPVPGVRSAGPDPAYDNPQLTGDPLGQQRFVCMQVRSSPLGPSQIWMVLCWFGVQLGALGFGSTGRDIPAAAHVPLAAPSRELPACLLGMVDVLGTLQLPNNMLPCRNPACALRRQPASLTRAPPRKSPAWPTSNLPTAAPSLCRRSRGTARRGSAWPAWQRARARSTAQQAACLSRPWTTSLLGPASSTT